MSKANKIMEATKKAMELSAVAEKDQTAENHFAAAIAWRAVKMLTSGKANTAAYHAEEKHLRWDTYRRLLGR